MKKKYPREDYEAGYRDGYEEGHREGRKRALTEANMGGKEYVYASAEMAESYGVEEGQMVRVVRDLSGSIVGVHPA